MKLNQFVVRQSELLGDIVIERRDAANAATLADSLGGSAEGEED
jgi:hypothetical protein